MLTIKEELAGIVLGALVAVGAIFGLLYYNSGKKVESLTVATIEQKNKIGDLERAVVYSAITNDIAEMATSNAAKIAEVVIKKQDAIHSAVKQKVAVIKQSYVNKDTDVSSLKEQSDAISAARIDGLWESYCTGMPADAECFKPSANKE